jgi:hypothetical protein
MTELLTKAFAAASKLSDEQQNLLAEWILAEIASEELWTRSYARSQDALAKLAEEALAEYRAGRTRVLDPDNL